MRHLPNMITCANLVFGLLAIRLLMDGDVIWVLFCFVGALLADFLDGMVARALEVSSSMGEELDSLADMVTFGVLPGCAGQVMLEEVCVVAGFPSWLSYLAYIYTVCAALRLARFNVDTRETKDFFGLNTPSAALAIMGMWYYSATYDWPVADMGGTGWFTILLILIIGIGLLCLSELPMLSLKPSPRDRHRSMRQIGLVLGAAVVASLYLPLAPLTAILWYVVYSAFHLINYHRR